MKRIIQTVSDSTNFQDLAGIGRGIYKVAEGIHKSSQSINENHFFETDKYISYEELKQYQNKDSNQDQQLQQEQEQKQKQQLSQQQQQQSNYQAMDSHLSQQEKQENQFDFKRSQFLNWDQKNKTNNQPETYEDVKYQAQQKLQEYELLQEKLKGMEKQDQQNINQISENDQKQNTEYEQIKQKAYLEQENQLQKQKQQINLNQQEVQVKKPLENIDLQNEQQKLQKQAEDRLNNKNYSYNDETQNLDFDDVFGDNVGGKVGQEQKVPEGSFSRAFNFGVLGVSIAGSAISNYVSTSLTGGEKPKSYVFSEKNAEKITKSLCKMRGAPLKLGQALSIQDDSLIPKEVRAAFDRARQTADIMPKTQLYYMLERELGNDWRSKFKEFDEKPVAAASIGQVHRAQLSNGRFVAVKIQYPGVKESIDSDLNNLKRLISWTGLSPKGMFIDQLIANTREELFQECDYKMELAKQQKYKELLKNDPRFNIPRVYPELSSERIFTSDYITGDSLEYIADNYPQEIKNDIGERIMYLTLHELFSWYYMQTDPNPSNFFYNPKQNVLHLIDFGAVHAFRPDFMAGYTELVYGAVVENQQQIIEQSIELGFLAGSESQTMLDAHCQTIQTVAEPFKTEGKYDFGAQSLTKRAYDLIPVMLKHRIKSPPPETYSLHRKFSGAYLLNMRLGSKFDCRSIFMPLYEEFKNKKTKDNN